MVLVPSLHPALTPVRDAPRDILKLTLWPAALQLLATTSVESYGITGPLMSQVISQLSACVPSGEGAEGCIEQLYL